MVVHNRDKINDKDMKICYFECFSGASGDMLLGALLGTGIDQDWFISELNKLEKIKDEFEVKVSTVTKKGISATDADVILKHHEHHHRGLKEITEIINFSGIKQEAKDLALRIFTCLAEAEAKVHNTDINHVHFHEVGAIDAIVDIVGFSILFTSLNIDKVVVSSVNTGSGFVKAAHGVLPVPAPATLEIIKNAKWPISTQIDIGSEALTPTGAAILASIKTEYGGMPEFSIIDNVSYGSGKKDFENIANVVRVTIGKSVEQQDNKAIWMLETNIDDLQPEFYEFILDKLFKKNALDAFLTPIIMKKSRPACMLTVLSKIDDLENLEKILFEETSTLGIRKYKTERSVLNREFKKVQVQNLGEVTIKISSDKTGNVLSQKPEYNECVNIAKEKDIPLKKVYEIILKSI